MLDKLHGMQLATCYLYAFLTRQTDVDMAIDVTTQKLYRPPVLAADHTPLVGSPVAHTAPPPLSPH